jgi:hypothetical protein
MFDGSFIGLDMFTKPDALAARFFERRSSCHEPGAVI